MGPAPPPPPRQVPSADGALPPLPPQGPGVPWPHGTWPRRAPGPEVRAGLLDEQLAAAGDESSVGRTRALVIVHRGRLVVEHYDDDTAADTVLPSWSLAKSVLHAAVGLLVGDGALATSDRVVDVAPRAVSPWLADPDDARRAITVEHLLRFRAGLAWSEAYTAEGASDVVDMLYRHGRDDVAGFVARMPLLHRPGSAAAFCYSSGTSNLLSAVVRERAGPGDAQLEFLAERLFAPVGITSADPVCDAAGTWVASTHCRMTACDLARFGLLYLRDGVVDDGRLLPPGWVDHGRSMQPGVADDGWWHGAHWWGLPQRPDWFFGSGYEGQYLAVSPARDVIVVRLGVSRPDQKVAVLRNVARLVRAFPRLDG